MLSEHEYVNGSPEPHRGRLFTITKGLKRTLKKPEIKGFPSPKAYRALRDGSPLFCLRRHIENGGCGSYFSILGNENFA